jgi:disulfide bond formation protein DsbB
VIGARGLALAAAGGSAALLAGAWAFQLAGYAPCAMCLWQRWPHWVAVALGLAVWALRPGAAAGVPPLAALGALAALATAGLGLFHTGVERGWWEGPAACSGPGLGGLGGAELLSLEGPALVPCDAVAWAFAGLSMASWNALLSLGLAGLWGLAAIRAFNGR